MSRLPSIRLALALAALACALSPAAASADQPHYVVSLTGKAKKLVSITTPIIPGGNCDGSVTEYENGFVSARLKASPNGPGAPLSGGSLEFGGTLAGLKAQMTREAQGTWTPQPGEDPEYCIVHNPGPETEKCKRFTDDATRKGTAPLRLTRVKGGKLGIGYGGFGGVAIDCGVDRFGGYFLEKAVPTTLRLGRVTGLAVGQSVSASGSATLDYTISSVVTVTKLTYEITVTRRS
ncbi:MAG TPA: hypothetical protein VK889_07590 [Solirubrobacterales bacterium]|nr:hypothetical protein [Solirubrobacterales bacterium]